MITQNGLENGGVQVNCAMLNVPRAWYGSCKSASVRHLVRH